MVVALAPLAVLVCSIHVYRAGARFSTAPTLVVDNSFLLDTTDPQRAYAPTSAIIDRAIYDTLFTYEGNNITHPVPLLVRSWTSVRYTTFTFQLKTNVHFADGASLTSADVVFSLRRLVNLNGNPAHLLDGFKVSAKGAYTVVIRSTMPAPQLPSILADASTGIVNSRFVESHGGTDAADASTADTAENWFNSSASDGAGSGPYELQSYEPESQVTLRPNPNYWGLDKPAFGAVVIRNMSAAAQLINIQHGSYQIALDLSSNRGESVEGDGGLRVSAQPSPWVFYAFTNDNPKISKITSNKHFQLAVRDALDYKGIAALAGPRAIQAPGVIPSMILGALPEKDALKQNLANAKAELAASGVGHQQVTLEYPSDLTFSGVSFATLSQKVQADLAAAGFNVALSGLPTPLYLARFRAGQVAFGLSTYSFDYPDPVNYLVFMPGNLVALHAGWSKDTVPSLARLAAKALVTTGPDARRSLYERIQLSMNDRGPFIPLIQPPEVFAATSDLNATYSDAYLLDITQVSPSHTHARAASVRP